MIAQHAAGTTRFTGRDARRAAVAFVALVATLTAVLAVDIFPSPVTLAEGDIAGSDIRAPRTDSYTSAALTEEKRSEARDAVEPQYDFRPEKANAVAAQQAAIYSRFVAPVDAAFSAELTDEERATLLESIMPELSTDGRAALVALTMDRWMALRDEASRVLDLVERSELRDTDVAVVRNGLPGRIAGDLSEPERALAAELIGPLVAPNSSFSAELTRLERDKAEARVAPVIVEIRQGQVLVRGGEKVTPLDIEELQAFGLDEARPDVARLGGWFVLAVLLVALVLAWVWRFRPALWHRNNVLILVGVTLLFFAFALKLTGGRSIVPYFVPTAAAGMLLAILLDAGVAIVVQVAIAILAGAVNGAALEPAAYVLLGGLTGIIAVRRGDRFGVFVQAGVASGIVFGLVVTTFTLLGGHDLTGLLQLLGASAAAAGGSAIAAVGSFAVLGNLFGILTIFQLLELANPSQPLLRRLLMETPGTYHHSLMVGNLAERAAQSIGADALLARVAAYYHDIGKLPNPVAFIENQAGAENVHDQLEPEVSAHVLKQHVADGIDLAYKHRLPKSLIAFIPQHHGTALMSYFWAKTREEAAAPFGGLENPDGQRAAAAIDERKFRHAGPKPQSREAAIIMLADSVEASVRSLASRDEAAIRAMVSRIIAERMDDGQFDECDLTLRDIEQIREAFVGQLLGMYHQRIAYPQNKIVEIESRRSVGGGGALR
jgi:putative nucleotidyltransferase with HDIG domain